MVPLESRTGYLSRINENPKLTAFYNFLSEEIITMPQRDLNESEEIYFGIIHAIQMNNKVDFEKYYLKKSKSKPDKDSPVPFINDDFLIFAMIVGINKFSIDKTWINHIISIRNRNEITITFENILNNAYSSINNIYEIVLIFLNLTNRSLITRDFVNLTFRSINKNMMIFESRSDFHIICTINSYDFIIIQKEVPEGSEITLFRQFDVIFKRRVKILSWILQIGIFIMLILGLLNLPKYKPEVVEIIERYNFIFTLLGALGITFCSNLIPFVRNKSQELLMTLFGYPAKLLNKKKDIKYNE